MTVLHVLGIVALLVVLAVVAFCFWLSRKVRIGLAWLLVETLDKALEAMKKKKEAPDHQPDAELDALIEEAEKTLPLARTALDNGDFKAVADITGPILQKLGDRFERTAKEQQAKEAEASKAPLALEAPTTKTTEADGAQPKTDTPNDGKGEAKGDDKPAQ